MHPFLLLGAFLLASIFFLTEWWRETDRPSAFFWLLLLAAGISNGAERFFFGCVSDFLSLPLLPLFNAADVALTVSVVFLVWRKGFINRE